MKIFNTLTALSLFMGISQTGVIAMEEGEKNISSPLLKSASFNKIKYEETNPQAKDLYVKFSFPKLFENFIFCTGVIPPDSIPMVPQLIPNTEQWVFSLGAPNLSGYTKPTSQNPGEKSSLFKIKGENAYIIRLTFAKKTWKKVVPVHVKFDLSSSIQAYTYENLKNNESKTISYIQGEVLKPGSFEHKKLSEFSLLYSENKARPVMDSNPFLTTDNNQESLVKPLTLSKTEDKIEPEEIYVAFNAPKIGDWIPDSLSNVSFVRMPLRQEWMFSLNTSNLSGYKGTTWLDERSCLFDMGGGSYVFGQSGTDDKETNRKKALSGLGKSSIPVLIKFNINDLVQKYTYKVGGLPMPDEISYINGTVVDVMSIIGKTTKVKEANPFLKTKK